MPEIIMETIRPQNGETVDLTNKIIDGFGPGRPDPSYSEDHPPGTLSFGLDLSGTVGVKVIGGVIRNCTDAGIALGGAKDVQILGTVLRHNCYAMRGNGSGIDLGSGAEGVLLDDLDIYENGQDAINGGDVRGLVLQNSYLHDHYLSHPDGIQLWGPNPSDNIEIVNNVIGNGFLQAIFLGENRDNGTWRPNAYVNNVKIENNLIHHCRYGIVPYHFRNRDWEIAHNTIADIEQSAIHLWAMGDDGTPSFTVRDNIVLRADHCIFRKANVFSNILWETRTGDWPNGNYHFDPKLDSEYKPTLFGEAMKGSDGEFTGRIWEVEFPTDYSYVFGFALFFERHPEIGQPIGPMEYNWLGDCFQPTEYGTLYYWKSINRTFYIKGPKILML
jgi:hypothetical protein